MLVLAGCGADGNPFGGGPEDPAPTGAAPDPDRPQRTIPPNFAECGEEEPKDGELVADVDLRNMTADPPPGFEESGGYHEDNPVEGEWTGLYFVPTTQQDTLDVINIVVYPQMELGPLTITCDQVSRAEIERRIEQYHEINGADVIESSEFVTVAGLPAVREVVHLPDSGYSGYSYRGYWIFGRGQVAHVYCQWVVDQATIERGCDDLIASLRVS